MDEAVYVLELLIEDKEKEHIRNTSEDDLINLHFGLGQYIRNNFGLWHDNLELLESCGSIAMHSDDASMVIVRVF